jgi:hypothetical protein
MDVNKTVYSVTVEHNGNSHTAPLIWQPSDFSVQPPTPPILKQDISNRYYYMTNFAEFVPMMNRALQQAWIVTNPTQRTHPSLILTQTPVNSS